MPKFNVSVPHALGQQQAREKLQHLSEKIKEKFQDQIKDFDESWSDDSASFSFKTMGFKIKGDIAVKEDAVDLEGDLPFPAMAFKGRIQNEIRETLEKTLGS